jgi:hypothetical protein
MLTSVSQPPRTVRLASRLYPATAITQARLAFAELCQFTEAADSTGQTLSVVPIDGTPTATVDEFLSYLLCAALEIHLAETP